MRRLTLPTEGGAVDGVSLMYGSTSGGGHHVEITQSARRADGLTMLVGLRRYAPAPGTLLLQGTSGLVRSNGLVVAILENFQQADGSVTVPPVLVPYVGREALEPVAAR